MENFVVVPYDQVVQKIKQHNPSLTPSIYLYENIISGHILPVFFLEQRIVTDAIFRPNCQMIFSGWATSYHGELRHLFKMGHQYSDTDKVSFERIALIQTIKSSRLIAHLRDWEIEQLESPFCYWYSDEKKSDFNVSRSQVYFWIQGCSELNQAKTTRTASMSKKTDSHGQQMGAVGVSPEKMNAMNTARNIAKKLWLTDEHKDKRITEMANEIYAVLHQSGFEDQLPDKPENVKEWIRRVAPEHAKKAGRPPKKITPNLR